MPGSKTCVEYPLQLPGLTKLLPGLGRSCPTRRVMLANLADASKYGVIGEGWTMDICGGAARGLPSHDADFVVSHPTK